MNKKEMSNKEFAKQQLRKINKLFKQIDREFYKIDAKNMEELNYYHNENASIGYCIRWGLQASEELINKDKLQSE